MHSLTVLRYASHHNTVHHTDNSNNVHLRLSYRRLRYSSKHLPGRNSAGTSQRPDRLDNRPNSVPTGTGQLTWKIQLRTQIDQPVGG